MRRFLALFVLAAGLAAAAGWILSAPRPYTAATFAGATGDAARGETVFLAAGCGSCHHAPGATGEARLVLAGGQRFDSAFGSFFAPNISPHPQAGIGLWSIADLGNALMTGTSPEGEHYYPAFPYTAYARMSPAEVADLHAFLMTLPADATPSQPHDLPFPVSIRRAVGLWKWLHLDPAPVVAGELAPAEARGRHLVEALGHCGECHTPRGLLGGLDRSRWLAGAPNPAGEGRVPNITPAALAWSEAEIAFYLETGFTPNFDVAGGQMAAVVANFARLPAADRAAVAAYLKRVPPVP
jgi:mono/diheme cytochrome c family protein